MYLLFQIIFPYKLLQNIEYGSLCYTAVPWWLSVFYTVVCLCIYFCFLYNFICIILFLDSTYKSYHMLFVFSCLTLLSMIIASSIHVAANNIISLFFMTLYMYHMVFIHLFVDAHLGYSLGSAIVNRTAMYIGVHESFCGF